MNGDSETSISTPYAGRTAEHYRRLSDAGLSPRVIRVNDSYIEAALHQTLDEWLDEHRSDDVASRCDSALRSYCGGSNDEVGLCHRDVRCENVVVDSDGMPLLIDPAYATQSMNAHCYDLEGPGPSEVDVPLDHVNQGGASASGIWRGSPQKHRSLQSVFGLPPGEKDDVAGE